MNTKDFEKRLIDIGRAALWAYDCGGIEFDSEIMKTMPSYLNAEKLLEAEIDLNYQQYLELEADAKKFGERFLAKYEAWKEDDCA